MPDLNSIPIINDLSLDARVTIARVAVVVVLFFVFWLLRHSISGLIARPIHKLVSRTDTKVDDAIMEGVSGVVSYLILAFTVMIVMALFDMSAGTRSVLFRLALSLVFFALIRFLFSITSSLTRSEVRLQSITGLNIDKSVMPVIRITTKTLLVIVGVLALAQVWGINLVSLVAGLGIAGVAVALAAKEILDDLIGFMIIMTDDPFTLDEYIVSPHAEGTVERINVRSTRVRQLNQGLVTVPNSKIVDDPIINWSRLEKRWFNFMLGVTYTSTAEQIQTLVRRIREMLAGRESVQDDSIIVYFTEYDDSSLNVLIRCYIEIEGWAEAKAERHDVNLEIMQIVNELDMSVAFPSRSLYLEQVPVGLRPNNGSNGKAADTKERAPAEEEVVSYDQKNGPSARHFSKGPQGHESGSVDEADYTDYDDDGE